MTEPAAPQIQWFPGHMVRAMRLLEERLTLVDVVIEVLDARLPRLSSNPDLDRLVGTRRRLVILGREDLADPFATRRWLAWYAAHDRPAVAVDGRSQPSVNRAKAELNRIIGGRGAGRGPARAIVIGIPNTGKSALINGLAKRTAAKRENKAGVTRQLRWIRADEQLEVMDTPGILVPKIPTDEAQWMLALTGALPRERYDPEDVVARFAAWAALHVPQLDVPDLERFAAARGFVRRGEEIDAHNAAGAYMRAFGEAKFGRITFEDPPETVKATLSPARSAATPSRRDSRSESA
ncbi:MAG: ribosome biogenesis GTPase YlqF [Candidatus Lustribacter sp.]